MKLNRFLSLGVLLLVLLSACSKKKTGTVTTLILEQTSNELLAHIKLDDGTEAVAFPKVFSKI